jgi:hypothetical protein
MCSKNKIAFGQINNSVHVNFQRNFGSACRRFNDGLSTNFVNFQVGKLEGSKMNKVYLVAFSLREVSDLALTPAVIRDPSNVKDVGSWPRLSEYHLNPRRSHQLPKHQSRLGRAIRIPQARDVAVKTIQSEPALAFMRGNLISTSTLTSKSHSVTNLDQ